MLLCSVASRGNDIRPHDGSFLCPLRILENKGQVTDQYGVRRLDVEYKISGNSLNVFVSKGCLQYQFYRPSIHTTSKSDASKYCTAAEMPLYDAYRLDMQLIGADPEARVVPENMQPFYERYLNGYVESSDIVRSYQRITYKNIYKNIDWCIYINGNSLEYDFIVNPGGNPRDIMIKYSGATSFTYTNNNINISTPLGCVKENNLHVFSATTHEPIQSSFVLKDSILRFKINNPNELKGERYIIDPTLEWGTYYGGSNLNNGYAVACDNSGNAYVTGTTTSTDNIVTVGAYQTTLIAGSDAFLAKFDINGVLLWGTYYGGYGYEVGHGICCDHSGNVYVTGETDSYDHIATTGAYKTVHPGMDEDAFIAKFSGSGALIWGSFFGGDSAEIGNNITCDALDNVYLAGRTTSHSNIATIGAYQVVFGGTADIFVAKFSPIGILQWSTYFGGIGEENSACIAINNDQNIFIGGSTKSPDYIATSGVYQTVLNGIEDAFLAKFNTEGSRLWATYYGGSGYDVGAGICTDNSGNIYMGGTTSSSFGIATPAAHQLIYGGGAYDAFLTKFDTSGTPLWGTYYGGAGNDGTTQLTCISPGNIAITGTTWSNAGISTSDGWQTNLGGTRNAFIADFNASGALLWGSYYGGDGTTAMGISSDISGNIYATGTARADSDIATPGAHQESLPGLSSAYLAKFGSFALGIQNDQVSIKKLQVYPVPNNGTFSVNYQFLLPVKEVTISVVSMDGRIQYFQQHLVSGSVCKEDLSLPQLPDGTYTFQISTGTEKAAIQFSISR